MTISRLFHLLVVLICLSPAIALAQMDMESGPEPEPDALQFSDTDNLIANYGFNIMFVHKPETEPGDATLRIMQPLSFSGCATVEPLRTKIEERGPTLSIIVANPVVKLDDSPRYSQFGCKQEMIVATADVTINRDWILANGINKVSFEAAGGGDRYDVYADERKISLFSRVRETLTGQDKKLMDDPSKAFFKPPSSGQHKDPLTYWFYPDNLVLLYAPNAPVDKDISKNITALARTHSLIEAEKMIIGFSSPLKDKNILYFIDQTGNLADKLRTEGPAQFGNITVGEEFQGASGPYNKAKSLAVYARLPGLMD